MAAESNGCALCGATLGRPAFPHELAWNGIEYTYRSCSACSTVTVSPLPTEAELERIFGYESYHAVELSGEDHEANERSLELLRSHAPQAAAVLDVGCGTGSFLRAAADAGYDGRGVEFEAEAIARAAETSGVGVGTLDEALGEGRAFDIVRLAHVLTAVGDPARLLRTLERLVAPGGSFLIESGVETNASLSRWLIPPASALKRRFGGAGPVARPPTLLWRTDRPTLRRFLEGELSYRVEFERLFDDGWPLRAPRRAPSGPSERVKHAFGSLAVGLSERGGPVGKRLGNKAIFIVHPPSQ